MIITLRLPAKTPVPVIGGVDRRENDRWHRVSGCRYTRVRGYIEASYTLEQLALCIGVADQIVLDKQYSL